MSRTAIKQISGSILILLVTISIPVLLEAQESTVEAPENTAVQPDSELPNGIYLVARWTEQREDLFPLDTGELLVEHNPADIEPDSTDPVKYVTVTNGNRVLFDKLKAINAYEQEDGRFNLRITMAEDSSAELERLSKSYLGRQVVIVIGGKAITLHKIRGIIRGGRLQIMRCTDDGCRVILKKLTDK